MCCVSDEQIPPLHHRPRLHAHDADLIYYNDCPVLQETQGLD